jgi:hypothetical protein
VQDIVHDANFLRAREATTAGFHGTFGFPIILEKEVVGVLEFFHHEVLEPDENLLEMMAAVGSQIGQFLRRKRLEEQLNQSQKMEAVGQLDDHFTNRWAAANGLDKTGRLRQAGKSLDLVGKDVRHAIPLCAADCLGPPSTESIAGSHPSPFHAASLGLSLPADLAAGSQGSAFQSTGC